MTGHSCVTVSQRLLSSCQNLLSLLVLLILLHHCVPLNPIDSGNQGFRPLIEWTVRRIQFTGLRRQTTGRHHVPRVELCGGLTQQLLSLCTNTVTRGFCTRRRTDGWSR